MNGIRQINDKLMAVKNDANGLRLKEKNRLNEERRMKILKS